MHDRPHQTIARSVARPARGRAATAAAAVLLALLGAAAPADAAVSLAWSDTATTATYRLGYTGTPQRIQLFLDTDRDVATGCAVYGIGANYLIENGALYRYSGSGGAWGWTFIRNAGYLNGNGVAEMTVARADLGGPSAIDLVGVAQSVGTTGKMTQALTPTSTPFGGVARAIPGRIEAEDFDEGGEGVGYHDSDAVNSGGGYRATGVDVRSCVEGGWQVGWMGPVEWLNYGVAVAATGAYDVAVRAASGSSGATIHLSLDGRDVTGAIAVATTGSWDAFRDVVRSRVALTAGRHVLRLTVDAGSLDVNRLVFTASPSVDTVAPTVPAGLTATAVSASRIDLAWSASSDDVGVTGYRIFRNGTQVGTATGTSYASTGLAASTSYAFAVAAVDAAGNASARSAAASATTMAATAPFTPPTLVNPVSPVAYGARADDGLDDSAAFQAAVNAGDVKIPPGTFLINRTVSITMSNRHIEGSPGTVLRQTDPFAGRMFNILSPNGGRLTGDSIVNCAFLGANTVAPQYYGNDARHWNIPVQTQDRVDNFFLAGNTFDRFFGQSMFQTYGSVDGGSGDVIIYNTFRSGGYYGPVLCAHRNGLIAHNTIIDCAVGVENDDAGQWTGGNVIEYNTITAVHGYGAPDMGGSAMLTGGAAGGADYSTNIVRYNTISGVSDAQGAHGPGVPSLLIIGRNWGVKAAQYIGNTIGAGCLIRP